MQRILSEQRFHEATERLLMAPYDLARCGVRFAGSDAAQGGTPEHRQLFADYFTALRPEAQRVADWWLKAIAYQSKELGSVEDARRKLILEYPAGPAADMHFIALVRRYWLLCDALNRSLPIAQWVDPQVLLLRWVIDAREITCADVLASQPYWPIGLSPDGEWF